MNIETRGKVIDSFRAGESIFFGAAHYEKAIVDQLVGLLDAAIQYKLKTGRKMVFDNYVHSRGGINFDNVRSEILKRNKCYEEYMGDVTSFGSTHFFSKEEGSNWWAQGDLVPRVNFFRPWGLFKACDNIRITCPHAQLPGKAHEMMGDVYKRAFEVSIEEKLGAL